MRISSSEWAVLFGDTPASKPIDVATMRGALDRAAQTQSLPPARIDALREQMRSVSSATHTASAWLDVQVGKPASNLELRVLRFLEARDLPVRVSTENGSNFGHQTAAIAAIRELRELGFAGDIELVVPRGAEEKMKHLLPPNDELGITVTYEHSFDPSTAPPAIGIVAASDHDDVSFSAKLGVGECLVLQPYEWPGERRLEVSGRETEPLAFPDASTYAYTVGDPLAGVEPLLPAQMDKLRAHVDAVMADQPPETQAKAAGILALMRGILSGRLDVMPAYGMHTPMVEDHKDTVLANLAGGVAAFQARQGADAKPAVVLAIGPDEPGDLAEPALNAKLRTAKKDDVFVLTTGKIPRPIFELFYQYATLPSVLEGASTSNLVQLMGKPFLSVFTAVTGLPELPGVDTVDTISEGLRKDQAEEQVERLGRMMSMFVSLGQSAPSEVFGPLEARLRSGEAMTAEEQATMKTQIQAAFAQSRPDLGVDQAEGFAIMVSEAMADLCDTLRRIPGLTDSDRQAIADFDPTATNAIAESDRILTIARTAIETMVTDRFADYLEAVRDPDSPTAAYYDAAAKNARADENRQLLRGLDRLREVVEGGTS